MDYLNKFEASIKNFEGEVSKLAKINKLIQDTATLIDEISKGNAVFTKSAAQLSEMQAQTEKNCATLVKIAENDAAARQKLLEDVHKNILADSKIIIEELAAPLENSRVQLAEICKLLKNLIETHQKSQEKFLSDIETVLIKYNTKNLEVYNNITGTLSNQINVAENKIETDLNLKFNNFAQDFSNFNNQIEQKFSDSDKKIVQSTAQLGMSISNISEEIKSLKEIISTIKIAVWLAVGTGTAACVFHFIK